MIPLTSRILNAITTQLLENKQSQIDILPTFKEQSNKAKTLWNGKRGSIASKAAFIEIKEKLIEMAVGVEICNYCENNEATDIEHIFPKDWFPNKTFLWENYLLACRTCNTDYKNNKFAVFYPENSADFLEVIVEPKSQDSAFINPQIENPLDFFFLNLERGIFTIHPNFSNTPQSREFLKASYTLEMLALNKRDALVAARISATKYYLDRLERYIKIKSATTVETLRMAIDPIEIIGDALFELEKIRLLEKVKKDIETYNHPTVWEELKRQKENPNYTRINQFFLQAPEALNW